MGRDENVVVFRDTEKLCKSNERLKASVRAATANQQLILEDDKIKIDSQTMAKYKDSAKVIVSKKRSFEAASAYKDMRVAVHNFASAVNPGGGVTRGSSAQEECLCRCSGLYFSLNDGKMWDGFYIPHRNESNPIHNDDIIYTPAVTVFKTDTANPQLMPEADWYDVDVITCAAPNLRENPGNIFNVGDGKEQAIINDSELLVLHEKRLRRILDVALANGDEAIILGAFGCGAFENNPDVVALAAKNVVEDYLHAFKVIEFAVYCSPRNDRNYKVFERVLGKIR